MYLPFSIRYRPKNFADVLGQDIAVSIIDYSIKNDKFASAYLFTGTRGTGKTTLARIIARLLNCSDPIRNRGFLELCGTCNSCTCHSHPDVVEIDAASRTGVDDMREIIESAEYRPIMKCKVFIIDEVHMLSKNAFNALLKTLEEPNEGVVFILATTEVEKVPLTILSRCQRFNLNDISTTDIATLLKRVCTAEKVSYDAASLSLISNKARGSARDSLMLLEQAVNYSDSQPQSLGLDHGLKFEVIGHIFGTLSDGEAHEMINCFVANGSHHERLARLSVILENVSDFSQFAEIMLSNLCDIIKRHLLPSSQVSPNENLHTQYIALITLSEKILNSVEQLRFFSDKKTYWMMALLSAMNGESMSNSSDVTTPATRTSGHPITPITEDTGEGSASSPLTAPQLAPKSTSMEPGPQSETTATHVTEAPAASPPEFVMAFIRKLNEEGEFDIYYFLMNYCWIGYGEGESGNISNPSSYKLISSEIDRTATKKTIELLKQYLQLDCTIEVKKGIKTLKQYYIDSFKESMYMKEIFNMFPDSIVVDVILII